MSELNKRRILIVDGNDGSAARRLADALKSAEIDAYTREVEPLHYEMDAFDLARIRAAEAKRARKAAQRAQAQKGQA